MKPRPDSACVLAGFLIALGSGISGWTAAAQNAAPAAGPAPASVTSDRLQKTRKALDRARREAKELQDKAAGLEQDIVRIRDRLVAAARVVQHHESRLGEIQQRIDALDADQAHIRATFAQRRRQLGVVLAALQRMARNPPESLLAQPVSPADTVRSAILLRATLPRLEGDARDLRSGLKALAAARQEAEERRREFDAEMKRLAGQRVVLQRLLGRKSRLRRRTVSQTDHATRRAMSLSKQAASLLELVTRLDALRAEGEATARAALKKRERQLASVRRAPSVPPGRKDAARPIGPPKGFSGRPFDSRKGSAPFPAVGRVAARYGQPTARGRTHKGVTLQTAKSAQVIAPYEGKVAFSGPFRGYGELLIIEHNGGYHTLLAGMARIDVAVGQWVLTGEPVGIMGREGVRKPALYLEIRRKGQPINPLPWLAVRKGKVSG